MKKPPYLEIMADELHFPGPSRQAIHALRIAHIKRFITAAVKLLRKLAWGSAAPILIAFILAASIHHEPVEQPKIVQIPLEFQLDAWQSVAMVRHICRMEHPK